MNERIRIECADKADRDELCIILARNGYTVRHLRVKKEKGTAYDYYVEFWKEG